MPKTHLAPALFVPPMPVALVGAKVAGAASCSQLWWAPRGSGG